MACVPSQLKNKALSLKSLSKLNSITKIDNTELVTLLNKDLPSKEKVRLLLSFIDNKALDAAYFNQAIVVKKQTLMPKSERIVPYWSNKTVKRKYAASKYLSSDTQYTTLANIIATNELNFTAKQMVLLYQALMAKNVDFSTIDNSAYQDLIFPKSGNNPLKSLIVSCLDEPLLIDLIEEFCCHIKHQKKAKIDALINNLDNFTYEAMEPAGFLLRLGQEHLAWKLYQLGAMPTKQDFVFACESFATTAHYQEAAMCINYLIEHLMLTANDIEDGVIALSKASPLQFELLCDRTLKNLKEESHLKTGHSSAYNKALKSYECDKKSDLSFNQFIDSLFDSHHPTIESIAKTSLLAANIGQGYFSEYYRVNAAELALTKFERLNHDAQSNQLLEKLLKTLTCKKSSIEEQQADDIKDNPTGKLLMPN